MNAIKLTEYDLSDISVMVDRGICAGSCPSYRIKISGSGELIFQGRSNVAVVETIRSTIDPELSTVIAKKLLDLDFFNLPAEIDAGGERNSSTMIVLQIGSRKKCVAVIGERVGIGLELEQIATELDHMANSSTWINGSNLSG